KHSHRRSRCHGAPPSEACSARGEVPAQGPRQRRYRLAWWVLLALGAFDQRMPRHGTRARATAREGFARGAWATAALPPISLWFVLERRAVDAVAQACGIGTVLEHMTEMGIA